MNCIICNNELSDKVFFGLTHKCNVCFIDFRIVNNVIEDWGINNGDLSLFGDRKDNMIKIWRIGSGNDAYLYKGDFKLPNKELLELYYNHIKNEVS